MSLNEYCARKLAAPGPPAVGPASQVVGRAAEQFGDQLLGVLAFGSWARGEAREDSDVDVLVVVDPSVPIVRKLYHAWDEQTFLWEGRRVEVHIVHPPTRDEPPTSLWSEAALDGVILFDPTFDLARRLSDARHMIVSGATLRVRRARTTNLDLSQDCVQRAEVRLVALDVLFNAESWADIVRESQEIVELALKGLLRAHGVAPPRVHDVSDVLEAERHRLPDALVSELPMLIQASRRLRRDRELAFYGAEDLTPSGFYERADAEEARSSARHAVTVVRPHVPG